MSLEELKTLGRRITDELLNQGDLTVAAELFDRCYIERVTACQGCGSGSEGVQKLVTHLRRAFPDLHSRIDDQIVDGQRLVQRITLSGTHLGRSFMGIPATGDAITFTVACIWSVDVQGKVREGWTYLDLQVPASGQLFSAPFAAAEASATQGASVTR